MKIPGSPSRARDAVGRTRTSRNSLVPLICSVSWTCLRSRPMNCLLWNEGLLGVAVERAPDTLADLHAAIGPPEGGGGGVGGWGRPPGGPRRPPPRAVALSSAAPVTPSSRRAPRRRAPPPLLGA